MSAADNKAVFLSYASQDAEAARRRGLRCVLFHDDVALELGPLQQDLLGVVGGRVGLEHFLGSGLAWAMRSRQQGLSGGSGTGEPPERSSTAAGPSVTSTRTASSSQTPAPATSVSGGRVRR